MIEDVKNNIKQFSEENKYKFNLNEPHTRAF